MPPSPLTRTRLRALADARAEKGRVVSVYLNLDPTHFATQPARANGDSRVRSRTYSQSIRSRNARAMRSRLS